MSSTKPPGKQEGKDAGGDSQLIVEEKIVKVNGETTVRKYAKGRFLGKVTAVVDVLGWVCPVLRVPKLGDEEDLGRQDCAQGLADQEPGQAEGTSISEG
jgi:hypothetical protein